MTFPFYYRKISNNLIGNIADSVRVGESVVLLAPRFGGKRYVIERLKETLLSEGLSPIVPARLLHKTPIITEESLFQFIGERLAEAGVVFEPEDNDPFATISRHAKQSGKPIILLASNVDGVPHHLARVFLERVRKCVEQKQMVVGLSGEYDFHELIYGPNSEFNCGYHYFLQGFDEDVFFDFIRKYVRTIHLVFDSFTEVARHLWEITGGNIYLLRLLLLTKIEELAHAGQQPEEVALGVRDFPGLPHNRSLSASYWKHIFRRSDRLIAREPNTWGVLRKLIKGEEVNVGLREDAPVPLEWSGVAVRDGTQLKFSSQLIADYIRRRYNNLYFGDLHAKHGMWDEAFALYNGLDRAEKMRPLDADDRGEVEKLISAFSAALHSVAAKGTEAVKRFFVNCCNALGFEEVTFWRREIDWQQRSVNGLNQYLIVFNQYLIDAVLRTLPKSGSVPPGVIPLTQPWERHAVAASLQTYNPDYLGAVIVSDEMVISRERRQLIETLLKHFVEAHSQALTVEKDQIKLEMRNRQVEIINSIFQAMGAEVRDAMQVFKMAAIGLRSLGYRRVLFCLVDPKVQKIQGVLDYSDNISVDVAKMTDYSLANPHIDIQPYVIATRRPAIIEDAANHPLTNKNAVQQTGMKALAIVPILNQFEEAIGTIHIERDDAAVPSREEVQDFIAFGRQLATAIEQSERVNLLQSALDKIPDPVVIVDSLERVRYANMPAGDLFRTKTGWSYRNEAGELRHRRGSPLRQYIREALTGIRDAHNVLGIGQDDEYRGQAICDYIKDWRTEIIGALMHITPINYLYKVLEAFRVLATANDLDSAMQAMLDAARILGHKWGRLYLLDEDDPSRLVSKFSFGMENAEEAEHFNSGKVILPRQDDTTMSWKSIDERMPIVFHWNPSLSDHTYTTKHGLEAVVISQPYEPALQGKKPGDFWIAFPLLTPEETLGKVSLQCDPDLRPEQYEMLKVLYEMAVGLWDAFLRRDRKAYDREQVIIEAAEKSMASIAHNLGSRLAPLDVLHSRYQAVSNGSQQLNDLNDDFARIIKHTLTIINRTKDLIYTVVPSYSQFDLIEMIRSALTTGLADQHLAINCAHPEVAIKADNELLTGALLELLQNSKEAIVMPADLRVTVDLLSVRRQTQNWVRIEYTDNGPGVKGELKKRIFDDFFSQRTGRKNGTGLGLGYVRRIVKAHGGTIKERGKYGSGAKFVIELPQSN